MSRENDKPVQPPSTNIPSAESINKLPSYASRNSKIFKAIIEFTDQLNESFGKDDVNILKVYRIINKTPLTNRKVKFVVRLFQQRIRLQVNARFI